MSFMMRSPGHRSQTASSLPSLKMVSSSTSALSFLKLRAAAGAGDGKGNTDGVIPVFGRFDVDSQALQAANDVTSIAYAKGAGGDSVVIIAGFNR